jgi:hypothetical protein
MIALNEPEATETNWQTCFLRMLPELQGWLRFTFRYLRREAREEAVEEGVVHCLLSYARLFEQGKTASLTPSTLAWYSSRNVKRGRPAVGRMNRRDPLSRYAQLGNRIHVESVHSRWMDMMVEDTRAPVLDQVAAKMDVEAWFATLTRRMRQIAKDLSFGCSTSEVARTHRVTTGRISQLRRSLEMSWDLFQQEASPRT